MDGGYDEGYLACTCFWGDEPSKFIRAFLAQYPRGDGKFALDLGCGEGKNAAALARAGYDVTAVDCSAAALSNATRHKEFRNIRWFQAHSDEFLADCPEYDVIVMYGLLHCLKSPKHIETTVETALSRTRISGTHIVASFNDGPQDLAAHPGLSPTLVSHEFLCHLYRDQQIIAAEDEIITETHPNNHIPHRHSISRISAVKKK